MAENEMSTMDTGAEVTETAAPSSIETESTVTEESAAPVQSAEDNARYAAARREAEAETKALQEKISKTNELVKTMFAGKVNPITKKEITTADEYFEAVRAQEIVRKQNELVKQGVRLDDLNSYMDEALKNNPVIKEAERVIELEKQRTAELEQQEMVKSVEADVKEIARLYDPSIKTVDDLIKKDPVGFAEMAQMCGDHNLTLKQAYILRNNTSIAQGVADKVKQHTLNQVNGKSHLSSPQSSANPGIFVPQDEMARLQKMFPGRSQDDLRKLYDRTVKSYQ